MLNTVRRSLRAKIVVVVLLTTFAALTISAIALLTYEARNYSAFLRADADTQAELLADITAPALAFDDPAAARTNLEVLSRRREISAAAVYSADGELFARYTRAPETVLPELGRPGIRIEGRTLSVFRPVVRNDEILGTVYLSSTYEVAGRVRAYVMILLGVMLPSLLVAVLISLWLAGSVTNPLRAVTDVANHVVARRDFTRRAPRTTDDEVGAFVDAFNTMVTEVGQRSVELETSNRALQQETDERRQAEAALRAADRRKDEFLATLAHELRNPLAPMVNAMQLLSMPNADAETTRKCYGLISRQLKQLVRLVDDLLDVSRITNGKLTVRKEMVALATVLQNAIDTARPLFEQRDQTIALDLPHQPIFLHGDAVRLAQVFANLLNNAAKYSETGTRIALRASVEGGSVRVKIDDEGIGIDADLLPSIFDMFTQGESNRAQSGLGVGLALARRLVELHDGTLVAESPGVGQGSSFTVTLPYSMAAIEHSAPAVLPSSVPTSARRRILLVDDNVDFATSMGALLRGLGHEVRIAHTGREALAVAREMRPELGLLDLGLPDTTGYELARSLRAQPETAATILVAVSGWGQPRDRERSREAGFALHLVKPVELNSIEATIAALDRSA